MKRFNQCVEVADIIKFSNQRIKDVEQFEGYKDKLFIQTQGARGLSYRLNSGWKHLAPVANDKVVDTAGAGDIGSLCAKIAEIMQFPEIKFF